LQAPLAHTRSGAQAMSHDPQKRGEESKSTQLSPQRVKGELQLSTQRPA